MRYAHSVWTPRLLIVSNAFMVTIYRVPLVSKHAQVIRTTIMHRTNVLHVQPILKHALPMINLESSHVPTSTILVHELVWRRVLSDIMESLQPSNASPVTRVAGPVRMPPSLGARVVSWWISSNTSWMSINVKCGVQQTNTQIRLTTLAHLSVLIVILHVCRAMDPHPQIA